MLKKDDLLNIANLSKIKISPDEYSLYFKDLDEIIKFASLISDSHTANVNKTFKDVNVLRADAVENEFTNFKMLSNTVSKDGFVTTVKVVE